MSKRIRKITVTLEENLADWARREARRQGISVSRLLARPLEDRMQQEVSYEAAMRRALARKPFLKSDGRYLSRNQTHDRSIVR